MNKIIEKRIEEPYLIYSKLTDIIFKIAIKRRQITNVSMYNICNAISYL